MIEIPDFLAKHGITAVEDNVPEGCRVEPSAFSGAFVTLFRGELMARLSDVNFNAEPNDDDHVK